MGQRKTGGRAVCSVSEKMTEKGRQQEVLEVVICCRARERERGREREKGMGLGLLAESTRKRGERNR